VSELVVTAFGSIATGEMAVLLPSDSVSLVSSEVILKCFFVEEVEVIELVGGRGQSSKVESMMNERFLLQRRALYTVCEVSR
jgi:hypothetical protein